MEELENNMEQNSGATQKPETGEGERLFTQAEVNEIVRTRLARAKNVPHEPTEAEKREKALTERESRMECREYLLDRGYPRELLDIIDTSDPQNFQKKADAACSVFGSQNRRVAPLKSTEPALPKSQTFGASKHTPRQYPPSFDE